MNTARPTEIEPLSNRFLIHPIGEALLPLAIRLQLHPTAVTATGLIFGLLAAGAYLRWADWRFATIGLLFMLGWHIMDGLDGKLARATGKTSALGRLLDGVADYTAFVAVNLALAFTSPDPQLALAAAILSGVCHILQALFYEGERATYIRRLAGNFTAIRRSQVGGFIEQLYNRGESLLGNRTRHFDDALAAADATERARLLHQWRQKTVRIFRLMAPLSANGRTFAIWVAVLLQNPMLYWIWEILPLTLLAFGTARALRQAEAGPDSDDKPAAHNTPGAMNGHA